MTYPHPIGLLINLPDAPPTPVPLDGVAVHARLVGAACEVAVTQRYTNRETRPIEAVYIFPLPTDAAVCGFTAEVDGRRIEGRVEEREKAFEIYDDAMADGHGAFLLDQERPNIFTASVGNIRPGASVAIEIRYVAQCPLEGDAVRFMLPTTVSPRYAPPTTTPQIGQPDHERIDPERRLHVPYGLTLKVDVESAAAPRRVESPSHPIRTTFDRTTTVELGQESTALDRDFVLLVELQEARTPTASVARDDQGNRYAQVQFIPTFAADVQTGNEVIFVVDCSGSMGGDSIAQAKRALELCIRALCERDTFEVIRFGSTYDALFSGAHTLDADALQRAVAHIAATDANLGGTEILAPLQAILARPIDPTRPRQILLLTDGQVSNETQVIELAKANAANARIFTFGIGAGVSEHLVKELARVTRGQVEMIHPGERIEPKVLRHFGRLRTPVLADVRVDWGGLEVEACPRAVPPVFQGELLTVFAKVRSGTTQQITLKAGAHAWAVPINLEHANLGGPVPKLWARAAIRDIESDEGRHGSAQQRPGRDREGEKVKKLVEIGKAHGLLSSATSYVAVEVRSDADKTTSPSELRKVPVALTAGWGGHGSARGGGGGGGVRAGGYSGVNPLQQLLQAQSGMAAPAGAPMPAPAPAPKAGGVVARAASAVAGVFGGRAKRSMDMMESDDSAPARRAAPRSPEPERARKAPGFAAPAREEAAADSSDALYDVLLTQASDGSFPLSAALVGWLGASIAAVRTAIVQHGEAKVATAVVLALLERDHHDRKDEWRAAAEKARAYLVRVGDLDGADLI